MFSHMRRVSPLHSSERQRSEVKPIMASKEDGDIRSAEVDKAHVAMGTENGGGYSSVAFSLTVLRYPCVQCHQIV